MIKRKTKEEFIEEMKIKQPNIKVLGEYINNKTGIYCQCEICGFNHYPNGELWTPTPNNLLKGTSCPVCSGKIKPHNKFIQEMDKVRPDIEVLGRYQNTHIGIHCRCRVCGFDHYKSGKKWTPLPNNILKGMGCPNCGNVNKTSFAEQAILFYLKQVTVAKNRYTEFKKEIDIWLPELNVGVEYNGMYWHKERINKDNDKINYFKNKHIRIIVVQDGDKNSINGDIITHCGIGKQFDGIDWSIKQLFMLLHLPKIDIDTNRDEQAIYAQYASIKKENSFEFNFPDKAKEWDYEKNGGITPNMVSKQSTRKFYRICPLCHTSYKTSLSNWVRHEGCHSCSGERQRGENNPIAKMVLLFDAKYILCKQFESERDAAKYLNISTSSVSRRCRDHKPLTFGDYIGYVLWHINDYENTTQ